MHGHKSRNKILFVVLRSLLCKTPCKRVFMNHAPCRPLPFHGNLAQRYKVYCKIISSNLANWLHQFMVDLWHGGMEK